MLKLLRITNVVLVEFSEIHFHSGLNVLSGETGSGKSAIMYAIGLIAGERADASLIRRGEEKAIVEAFFEIEGLTSLIDLLEESGIDHDPEDELIIRRELFSSGKSRAFVNNQAVQISLLKRIGEQLLNIVAQHSSQWLLSTEKHRQFIDIFGDHQKLVEACATGWNKQKNLQDELNVLVNSEAQRLRDIEKYRSELDELTHANLKEGEEEELFSEYTVLTNAEELASKIQEINETLSGERLSIIALLNRHKTSFEQILRIDSSLTDTAKSLENALLELQEVAYTLRNYYSNIEHNPSRAFQIDERLCLLTKLKKKYGTTVSEIQIYQKEIERKLDQLENADVHIEELQKQLLEIQQFNDRHCEELTQQRNKTARALERALAKQLQALNMAKAKFHVEILKQNRSLHGDDFIEFYLAPNVGEHRIPIKDCASGGELSRLLLALQSLLTGKEQTPTLIFDEIDANIGGATATIVGEKLKEMGQKHQVLCITHFPQVASQAQHHIQISKREIAGRTVTIIETLDSTSRQRELDRMHGSAV